jgi:rubrerythrin
MSFEFNVDEILVMAEQIERNGIHFYRKAAENLKDARVNKLLLDLAAMEVEHERFFSGLRKSLQEKERQKTVFDPEDETAAYLRAMADGHVFDVRKDPEDLLTGNETLEEILQLAIGREKDSIVFYLGLKEMLSTKTGKDQVEEIIKEEMRHIALLNKEMAALKRAVS